MRALVNAHLRLAAVPAESDVARAFHRALPGYAPTPLHYLPSLAAELGIGGLAVKDESNRLGLPTFKVLGASWAIERALQDAPGVHTLVAASTGNRGRAVAHVAGQRGLACRVFLPQRALAARRSAIVGEGAEVVVVEDGDYEDAVRAASAAGREPGVLEISGTGDAPPAHAVIDGYATLFAEMVEQAHAPIDVVVVPVGVGALAAAAARCGARTGARVVGVEPTTAACLTTSLAAGTPTPVPTPGTTMAGMDSANVSSAAWPSLRDGLAGTVLVEDAEIPPATDTLARVGLHVGECAAATLVGLHTLVTEPAAAPLRQAAGLDRKSTVVLIATEGHTGQLVPSTGAQEVDR